MIIRKKKYEKLNDDLVDAKAKVDDAKKDHESDTKGLDRTVTVYSKTGEVVKQYKGDNVRTKYNDGGALVINVDGKRVQVMNSDVVIEEKGAEKYKVSN